MRITAKPIEGSTPLTVMKVDGELDASNFQEMITRAQTLYRTGVRDMLLDLSNLGYMSSSGLVALHSLALIMQGETPSDPGGGWGAFRAIDRDREAGLQCHVKLLNPQVRVSRVLATAGFDRFFEIYTDMDAAIASF